MWGSWFGLTMGGVFVVLLIIALAFGTSALLIPVIVFAGLMALLAAVYALRGGAAAARELDSSKAPDPVRDAAPASGEGTHPLS